LVYLVEQFEGFSNVLTVFKRVRIVAIYHLEVSSLAWSGLTILKSRTSLFAIHVHALYFLCVKQLDVFNIVMGSCINEWMMQSMVNCYSFVFVDLQAFGQKIQTCPTHLHVIRKLDKSSVDIVS
jgi:hypothetical protein